MPFVFNVRAQNFNEKCQCAREVRGERGGTSSPATRGRTCDNPIGKAQPQRTGSEPCLMQFVIQHKMPGIRLTTTQASPCPLFYHPLHMPIRPRFIGNSSTHYPLSFSHLTSPPFLPFTRGDLCRRGCLAGWLPIWSRARVALSNGRIGQLPIVRYNLFFP